MAAAPKLLIQTIRDVTIVNFEDASILDAAQIEALGSELYPLVEARACRKLILDLTKVKFLSSSALGILINLRSKAAAIKGKLVICGLRKELLKVFQVTGQQPDRSAQRQPGRLDQTAEWQSSLALHCREEQRRNPRQASAAIVRYPCEQPLWGIAGCQAFEDRGVGTLVD